MSPPTHHPPTQHNEQEFEHSQTLDRTKNRLMKEEMAKAPSEGAVLPVIPPILTPPERFSMPPDEGGMYEKIMATEMGVADSSPLDESDDDGYELLSKVVDKDKLSSTDDKPQVQTTSFMSKPETQTNESVPNNEELNNGKKRNSTNEKRSSSYGKQSSVKVINGYTNL